MTKLNDNAFLERTLRGRVWEKTFPFGQTNPKTKLHCSGVLWAFFRLEFVGDSKEYLTFQLGASFCLCGACAKNASDMLSQNLCKNLAYIVHTIIVLYINKYIIYYKYIIYSDGPHMHGNTCAGLAPGWLVFCVISLRDAT